jgi:hypothetical protein
MKDRAKYSSSDRQLTRSKHEAHGGEDMHLAAAMDP